MEINNQKSKQSLTIVLILPAKEALKLLSTANFATQISDLAEFLEEKFSLPENKTVKLYKTQDASATSMLD